MLPPVTPPPPPSLPPLFPLQRNVTALDGPEFDVFVDTLFDETDLCNGQWTSVPGCASDARHGCVETHLHVRSETQYGRCYPHDYKSAKCGVTNLLNCVISKMEEKEEDASPDSRQSAEETAFRKAYLQFHFATMEPINVLGNHHYSKVRYARSPL